MGFQRLVSVEVKVQHVRIAPGCLADFCLGVPDGVKRLGSGVIPHIVAGERFGVTGGIEAGGSSQLGFFYFTFETHFLHDLIDGQGLRVDARHLVHLGGKLFRHRSFEEAVDEGVIVAAIGDADTAHSFAGGAGGIGDDVGFFAKFDDFAAHRADADIREKMVTGKFLVEVVAEDDFGEDGVNDAQALEFTL